MKQLLIIILISLLTFPLKSQTVVDSSFKLPASEKLHYDVYYKLGAIWIKAGLANFSTDTITVDSVKAYRFIAKGYSMEKYGWIFNLEDYYRSVAHYRTLYPIRFEKENTEQGVWVHTIYNFNKSGGEVGMYMESTGNEPVNRTVNSEGFITDALSALYYLRTWDYNHLRAGDTVKFNTILDGKIFKQPVVYLGKDTLISVNHKRVPMIKFGAIVSNSTFFRSDSAIEVWLTNDRYRRIAKVKAKIVVGSIVVYLNKRGLQSFGPE